MGGGQSGRKWLITLSSHYTGFFYISSLKYSTICECDQIIQNNIDNDRFLIPTTENTFDVEISRTLEIPKAKLAVKKSIKDDVTNLWNSKVQSLTMQGDFTNLLIEEKENVTWQSVIRNVPRGIMSFALKSITKLSSNTR